MEITKRADKFWQSVPLLAFVGMMMVGTRAHRVRPSYACPTCLSPRHSQVDGIGRQLMRSLYRAFFLHLVSLWRLS
jgi:hypothetical protein